MFLVVRRYQSLQGSIDDLIEQVNRGFVPLISEVSGFRDFYYVNEGGGRVFTVSVFETEDSAKESIRLAANWIKQNMPAMLPQTPEVYAGSVVIQKRSAEKQKAA